MTPLPVVGLAECPAVAGRAAEVDVEDREALRDEEMLEGHERAELLAGRAAVRPDHRRDPACPALAGRARRPPQRALEGEPVARLELDPFGHGRPAGGQCRPEHGRHRIGHLSRPRPIGRDAGNGQQPQVLRRGIALADRGDPGPVREPADGPPHAVPRIDPAARRGRADRAGLLRRATPAPLGRLRPAELADEQVLQAVVDLDVDEPAAVRRRQGNVAGAAARLAVLALPGGQDDPIVPVGGQPDDLEPAVCIRHEQERAIGHPLGADVAAALAGDDPRRTGRDVDQRDLGGLEVLLALAHDRDPGAIGRPGEGVDVDPGFGQGGRSGRTRLVRRPTPAGHRRVDQPDLGPAATSRQERDPMAVGRPARLATTPRSGDDAGQARPVDLDDPDLLIADVREPATVG